jgi:hypothetical protein
MQNNYFHTVGNWTFPSGFTAQQQLKTTGRETNDDPSNSNQQDRVGRTDHFSSMQKHTKWKQNSVLH